MTEKIRPYVRDPKYKTFEQEAEELRRGLSDDDLIRAWAETGDERYLTPSTMTRMGMDHDADGHLYSPNEKSDDEIDDEILREAGVCTEHLADTKDPREIVAALLPAIVRHVDYTRSGADRGGFVYINQALVTL